MNSSVSEIIIDLLKILQNKFSKNFFSLKRGHFLFQLQHEKSLDVITPVLTIRKSLTNWKPMTFLGPTRELRFQSKPPSPNLKRQVFIESHSWDLHIWSRSCWSHKNVPIILYNMSGFQQNVIRHAKKIGKINKSKSWFFE